MPGFNIGGTGSQTDPANTIETSRANRYVLEVLGQLPADLLVFAHKCGRPSIEVDRITIHHGQDEIYYPGKSRWKPIEISFYEIHKNNSAYTSSRIYSWWAEATVNISQSRINTNFKRDGALYMQDGTGSKIWEYDLLGTWPSNVNPDGMDYSSSAISEITVTLSVDKCRERPRVGVMGDYGSSCDAPIVLQAPLQVQPQQQQQGVVQQAVSPQSPPS